MTTQAIKDYLIKQIYIEKNIVSRLASSPSVLALNLVR